MAGGFPEWRFEPKLTVTSSKTLYYGEISDLTATKGRALFQVTPSVGSTGANGMYIAHFVHANASTSAFISLHYSGNSSMTLTYNDGGGTQTDAENTDVTGELDGSTAYDIRIEYDKTYVKAFVDNTEYCTISGDINFNRNNVPNEFYLGQNSTGSVYTGATFDKPDISTYDIRPRSSGIA